MGPEYYWWPGMWFFPRIVPVLGFTVMLVVVYSGGGFTVHFFSRERVTQLARGFDILSIDEFEEGALPRKLFRVTLRKKATSGNVTRSRPNMRVRLLSTRRACSLVALLFLF